MSAIFYVDPDENKSSEDIKAEEEELNTLANRYLKIGELSDKEGFPEFLWEAQINDEYDENYKLLGSSDDPYVQEAYTIRKYYNNFWKYIDALEIYNAYMDYLEDTFGNLDILKNSARMGLSPVHFPDKPKLMNKKENKRLLKSGMLPSRFIEGFVPDVEAIRASIESLPDRELSYDDDYELPKGIRKLYEKEILHKVKSDRVNSMFYINGADPNRQGIDAIINAIMGENTMSMDDRGKKGSSMAEAIEDSHAFDYIPEDIINEEFMPHVAGVHSEYLIDPKKQAQKEILLTLTENGFNFLNKSIMDSMDDEVVRAVRKHNKDKFGDEIDYENMSKKQIKKLKKKKAKEAKYKKDRLIGDRRLQSMLLSNRINLSNENFANFRLSDCFKDY